MSYVKESCESFVKSLASKAPTPGGGGASALVGAVGTALGNMVGSLTVGKRKYESVETEIRGLIEESERIQEELLELVRRDAEAFAPLAEAYGMPKDTQKAQAKKQVVMEQALKGACEVPLEIMEKCCRGIELCGQFADKGSSMAISDAGAGAAFCRAALQSASLNVYINTKLMKERDFAEKANEKADNMLSTYMEKADRILEQVFAAIK